MIACRSEKIHSASQTFKYQGGYAYPVVVNDFRNHCDLTFLRTGLEEDDWRINTNATELRDVGRGRDGAMCGFQTEEKRFELSETTAAG